MCLAGGGRKIPALQTCETFLHQYEIYAIKQINDSFWLKMGYLYKLERKSLLVDRKFTSKVKVQCVSLPEISLMSGRVFKNLIALNIFEFAIANQFLYKIKQLYKLIK